MYLRLFVHPIVEKSEYDSAINYNEQMSEWNLLINNVKPFGHVIKTDMIS